MAGRKVTEEEAKSPDAFITTADKILAAIERQKKPILAVVALAILGGGAKVGFDIYMNQREEKAQEAFYKVEKDFLKKQEELDKAKKAATEKGADKNKTAKDKKAEVKKPDAVVHEEPKTPELLQSRFGDIVSRYESFIKDYPGSKASYMAIINLADLYQQYGEKEKAKAVLESASQSAAPGDLFFGLVHSQLAAVLSDLNQFDKSNDVLEKILKNNAQSFFFADTLLKIGVNYENLKNVDKAKEYYQRVEVDHGKSNAAKLAKTYLRLLETKQSLSKGQG